MTVITVGCGKHAAVATMTWLSPPFVTRHVARVAPQLMPSQEASEGKEVLVREDLNPSRSGTAPIAACAADFTPPFDRDAYSPASTSTVECIHVFVLHRYASYPTASRLFNYLFHQHHRHGVLHSSAVWCGRVAQQRCHLDSQGVYVVARWKT